MTRQSPKADKHLGKKPAEVPVFAAVVQPAYTWREIESGVSQEGVTGLPRRKDNSAVLISPSSKNPTAIAVRAHELLHARFTPDVARVKPSLEKSGVSELSIQLAEDVRIQYLGKKFSAWPEGGYFQTEVLRTLVKSSETQVEKASFVLCSLYAPTALSDAASTKIDTEIDGPPQFVDTTKIESLIAAICDEGELTEYTVSCLESFEKLSGAILERAHRYNKHGVVSSRSIVNQYTDLAKLVENVLLAIADPPKDKDDEEDEENKEAEEGDQVDQGGEPLTHGGSSSGGANTSWRDAGDEERFGDETPETGSKDTSGESVKFDNSTLPEARDLSDEEIEDAKNKDKIKRSLLDTLGLGRKEPFKDAIGRARRLAFAKAISDAEVFEASKALKHEINSSRGAAKAKERTGTIETGERSTREAESFESADKRGVVDSDHGKIWVPMDIARPELTRENRCRVRRRGGASTTGLFPRHLSRWYVDRAILETVGTNRGGTLLLDVSGSMSWARDRTLKMIEKFPALTIAAYSSHASGVSRGVLTILARSGRLVSENDAWESLHGGENVCDGAALSWLAKQPGPRVWFSDGAVTAYVNGSPRGDIREASQDAYRIMKAGNIFRTRYVKDVLNLFRGRPNKCVQDLGEMGWRNASIPVLLDERARRSNEPDTFDEVSEMSAEAF